MSREKQLGEDVSVSFVGDRLAVLGTLVPRIANG